ncbi:MAG TPA: AsmA family protein, partial [Acidobacteria bacterium]|nr:AsmA family protein [Acidobacteriota bacterium]
MDTSRKPRRRRWIVVVGIVLLLLVAVVAALPLLVDAERYRPAIEKMLSERTGWQTRVGELDFSLWGGAALRAEGVSLAAAGESSRVEIGRLDLAVDPWALLRGRLDVRHVVLVEPRLRLVRESQAEGWVLPGGAPPSPESAEPVTPLPAAEADPSEPAERSWSVERIEVSGGRLEILDRSVQPPLELAIAPIDLRMDDGRARGGLAAESLTLPGGLRPLGPLRFDFVMGESEGAWKLEEGDLEVEGLEVQATGALFPILDLTARLQEVSLPALLKVAGAFFPLPFEAGDPSAVTATVRFG